MLPLLHDPPHLWVQPQGDLKVGNSARIGVKTSVVDFDDSRLIALPLRGNNRESSKAQKGLKFSVTTRYRNDCGVTAIVRDNL